MSGGWLNGTRLLPQSIVLPKDLVESEGHIQGSFAGATNDRAGLFDQADVGRASSDGWPHFFSTF